MSLNEYFQNVVTSLTDDSNKNKTSTVLTLNVFYLLNRSSGCTNSSPSPKFGSFLPKSLLQKSVIHDTLLKLHPRKGLEDNTRCRRHCETKGY